VQQHEIPQDEVRGLQKVL